jgi:mRNA interferase RelE/StbE
VSYRLVYTRRAVKDLQGLDEAVRQRIGRTLKQYEQDPLRHARRLVKSELGTYRFRIGAYRVIFDLVGSDIVLLRIGHRSKVYTK